MPPQVIPSHTLAFSLFSGPKNLSPGGAEAGPGCHLERTEVAGGQEAVPPISGLAAETHSRKR